MSDPDPGQISRSGFEFCKKDLNPGKQHWLNVVVHCFLNYRYPSNRKLHHGYRTTKSEVRDGNYSTLQLPRQHGGFAHLFLLHSRGRAKPSAPSEYKYLFLDCITGASAVYMTRNTGKDVLLKSRTTGLCSILN